MMRLSNFTAGGTAIIIAVGLICSTAVHASEEETVPLSRLQLVLIGTYVTEHAQHSFAIVRSDDAKENLYKLKDEISGDVTLQEIHTDKILIKNAGRIEAVELTKNTTTTGSGTEKPQQELAPATFTSTEKFIQNHEKKTQQYPLQPFDKLYISVENVPDLTMWQTINESGSINYSYLGGLEVAGLTQQETLDLITTRLQSGYLTDPVVDISVTKHRSFDIDGGVVNPGNYELTPGLTLESAINIAGGLTERAAREKIALTRIVNNDKQVYRAGLLDLIEPGDFIEIKEGFF